eukprot:gene5672-7058_t
MNQLLKLSCNFTIKNPLLKNNIGIFSSFVNSNNSLNSQNNINSDGIVSFSTKRRILKQKQQQEQNLKNQQQQQQQQQQKRNVKLSNKKNDQHSLYDYEALADDTNLITTKNSYFVFGDERVEDILKRKSQKEVLYVSEEDTTDFAVRKMVDYGVAAMLVIDPKSMQLRGIVTERDYITKLALKKEPSQRVLVKDIMTTRIRSVTPDTGVVDVMQMMTNNRFRHVPVTDFSGNRVLGVISITDITKSVQKSQKETIKFIREYLEDAYSYSYKPKKEKSHFPPEP